MRLRALAASFVWVSVASVKVALAEEAAPAQAPVEPSPAEAPAQASPAETAPTQASPEAASAEAAPPAAEADPAQAAPAPTELPAPKDPAPVAESAAPLAPAIAPLRPEGLGATAERPPPANPSEEGPLGPFRAGLLAGVGAPSVMSAQMVGSYKRWVGLAAEVGMLPTVSLPIGEGVAIQQSHMSLAARVHPFRGMFFVGCGIGASTLQAKTTATSHGVAGQLSMTAKTVFVNPQLGFLHRFRFGLALGMDVGVQLPLSGSSSADASIEGTAVEAPAGVRNAVAFAQRQPIPMLNLLRIGYVL